VPEVGLASARGDSNADGQDVLTDKQRRKAERKAEKRKRREAEAIHATPEGVSTAVKEQMDEEDAERAERTSKKEKKRMKRHERNEQAPANQSKDNDDDTTEKKHEHDTSSGPLLEPKKKFKREHKKERS
jgi:hypothetical protein